MCLPIHKLKLLEAHDLLDQGMTGLISFEDASEWFAETEAKQRVSESKYLPPRLLLRTVRRSLLEAFGLHIGADAKELIRRALWRASYCRLLKCFEAQAGDVDAILEISSRWNKRAGLKFEKDVHGLLQAEAAATADTLVWIKHTTNGRFIHAAAKTNTMRRSREDAKRMCASETKAISLRARLSSVRQSAEKARSHWKEENSVHEGLLVDWSLPAFAVDDMGTVSRHDMKYWAEMVAKRVSARKLATMFWEESNLRADIESTSTIQNPEVRLILASLQQPVIGRLKFAMQLERFQWWLSLRLVAFRYRSGDEMNQIVTRQRVICRHLAGVESAVEGPQECGISRNTTIRMMAIDKEIGRMKATRYLKCKEGQTELDTMSHSLLERFPRMVASIHGLFALMEEYLHDVDVFEIPFLLEFIYGSRHPKLVSLVHSIQKLLLTRPIHHWQVVNMTLLEALCNRYGVMMLEPSIQRPSRTHHEVADYIIRAQIRKKERERAHMSLNGAETNTNQWFFQSYRWLEAMTY